jgi:hypothetical protein
MRTPNYVYKMQTYEEFYANLTNEVFFELDPSVLNYGNAYELYEYAAYQYEHNKTIYNSLHTEDLAKLRNLASLQQWAFNTPDNGHSVDGIAGQTLAGKMLSLLAQVSFHVEFLRKSERLIYLAHRTSLREAYQTNLR